MKKKEEREREKGDEKEIERECGGNMQNISCHTSNELYRKNSLVLSCKRNINIKEIKRECGRNMQNISCRTWNELYRKK